MTEEHDDEFEEIIRQGESEITTNSTLSWRVVDYYYDKVQEAYWDITTGALHRQAKTVDGAIPKAFWPLMTVPLDDEVAQKHIRNEQRSRHQATGVGRGRPNAAQAEEDADVVLAMVAASGREGHVLIKVKPSVFLERVENGQQVDNSTWWPGKPTIIDEGLYIGPEGIRRREGARIYNTYSPPKHKPGGDAEQAGPWIDHIKLLWPNEIEHEFFFNYCAHMVQRPGEKCNTAVILSGKQGIGKDTALTPLKYAVGDQNHKNIDPDTLFSQYRPWLRSVLLMIDEVRVHKEEHKASGMYDILKQYVAAPPSDGEFPAKVDLNDKYRNAISVINVLRVVMTTNDYMALYIPADDRRMFIMHSERAGARETPEETEAYFNKFVPWLADSGSANVTAWLMTRDLSKFNPSAPAPRTAADKHVIASWKSSDEDIVAQRVQMLKETYPIINKWQPPENPEDESASLPPVIFQKMLYIDGSFDRDEMKSIANQRQRLMRNMTELGYKAVVPDGKREYFLYKNEKQKERIRGSVVYVRAEFVANLTSDQLYNLIDEVGRAWVNRKEAKTAAKF